MVYMNFVRDPSTGTVVKTDITGDVKGKTVIIVGDFAGKYPKLMTTINTLEQAGATSGILLTTYSFFPDDVIKFFAGKPWLSRIIVGTNLPQTDNRKALAKVETVDLAPLFVNAIRRIVPT